jgi:hypothetical protein
MFTPFRHLPAIALSAVALPLAGCEGGEIEINGEAGVPLSEIELAGPPPSEVILESGDTVILTEGPTFALTVEGTNTDSLRFVRDSEVIGISRENGWTGPNNATIRITMPAPREVVIGGSGKITAQSLASQADINIGGSGSVLFERVAAERLGINIGGSGSVQGAGTAKTLEILIGGSGKVAMPGLKADTAEVNIGGSGDVAFASDGTVEANIGGAGDVRVAGSAKCTINAFGSGTLTCAPAGAAGPAAE